MVDDEMWKPIKEFPEYLVSDQGRIKRITRLNARKLTVNEKGFPIVVLWKEGGKARYVRQVNKLVAEAFLPPAKLENEKTVWHVDGDLTNCHAANLRWENRAQVLEWNEMHRTLTPRYTTPKVKNNITGEVYENAFECGMAEGETESKILWRIEQQARHVEDVNARYRYLFK